MKARLLFFLTALVLLLPTLSSCVSDTKKEGVMQATFTAPDNGEPLREVSAPPSAPPLVSVNGVEAPLLSYEWWDGSEVVSDSPTGGGNALALPQTNIEVNRITITVDYVTPPDSAEFRFFTEISDQGIPSNELTPIICENQSACDWVLNKKTSVISFPKPERAVVVVVMLFYGNVLNENDDTVPAIDNYASYGMRVK